MPRAKSNKTLSNDSSSVEKLEKVKKPEVFVQQDKKATPVLELELKKGRKKKSAEKSIDEVVAKKPAEKRSRRKATVEVELLQEKPTEKTPQKGRGGRKATMVKIYEADEVVHNGAIKAIATKPLVKNIKGRKKKEVMPEIIETVAADNEIIASKTTKRLPKAKGRSMETTVDLTRPLSPRIKKLELVKKSRKTAEIENEADIVVKTSRGRKRMLYNKSEEIIKEAVIDQATPKKKSKKTEKSENTRKRIVKQSTLEEIPTISENEELQVEVEIAPNKNSKKIKSSETKPRGGRKRVAIEAENEDDTESINKRAKIIKKSNTITNTITSKYNKEDFTITRPAEELDEKEPYNLKISSWNVAGLRSWLKKDGLQFLDYEEPDIFCLQEIKCTIDQLPEAARISGYHPYWLSTPGGHAGVAVYSKIMPINVEYGIGNEEFDNAGRIITAEYEKFYLINVYVPNSGRKLVNLEPRMRWEKLFQAFIQKLDSLKPVIICGDMNVSHKEIDLANPKTNTRNAGFTQEERDKMSELIGIGYVDTFRHLYPERSGAYTFWTYMGNARSRNIGWRLDYFIVSNRFIKRVIDNCIRQQCLGSDHCPITLYLKL